MTIEQVKEEAKKRFDKDLTDEQAQAWLDAHPTGELQDNELADVAGGGCGSSGSSSAPSGPQPKRMFRYDICPKYEGGSIRQCSYCNHGDFNRHTGFVWCHHPDNMS